MQAEPIKMDRAEARHLYREYRKHAHYSQPIDREVMQAYYQLARGKLVIKALESIVKAGTDEQGHPKLAIARADAASCRFTVRHDGTATMTCDGSWWRRANSSRNKWFDFPKGAFPDAKRIGRNDLESLTPPIPLHLRPKRGLANYHILWEAEWTRVPPRDPYLLRRIGKGDMWLVVAMWDLTEVERMALAARIETA